MEIIVGIILIALALYLLYLLVVYIIIPIASFVIGVTLVVSAGYGLIVSLASFFSSLAKHINPYETYIDNHKDVPAGARRNYFFGPGLHQISQIVKGAFENLGSHSQKLTDWKEDAIVHSWFIDMWIYIGYIIAIICTMVFGLIWVSAFSIILFTVIVIGMVAFFAFFSGLWLIDRIVLAERSIHSRCPNCKRISIIPVFICSTCGMEHRKLVPGPYGILKRKCCCGTMLSTTFIGGRSKYEAHCRFCDTELFTSDSRQYGIQLVGGIGTGKTTFLAAFWHEYKDWLNKHGNIAHVEKPIEAFSDLEYWFNSGKSESTLETNANMYSIIHKLGKKTSVQMTIYDIAGEAFDFAGSETQQQQFRYCEGFIIVIDPTAKPDYISETITNFINSFEEVKGKYSNKAINVPVAIIITKSDLYKKEIGLPKIKSSYKTLEIVNSSNISLEAYQSITCRDFLLTHGYGNAINIIEAEFSNVNYFPVSSMGHCVENTQYEPWGILNPIFWLINNNNCPLREIIKKEE